ncbi:MAG: TIGR04282 family arsenosugar biosynthesis glycosyltransferase [Planctomycetota bacterium]
MSQQTDSAAAGSTVGRPAVAYFAKVPRPGRVKTRLVPPLTPAEAAGLYAAFLADGVREVAGARTLVYGWPGDELDTLAAHLTPSLELRAQCGEDLFARMEACLAELLAEGHRPVLIRNTDSPDLPAARLQEAIVRCLEGSVVLGPDEGGGYYLVAMSELHRGVLAPDWTETRDRAIARGLRVEVLATEPDVDTFDDLLQLWRRRAAGASELD